MKITKLIEAFQAGNFPETDDTSVEFQQAYGKLLVDANKIADVRPEYSLHEVSGIYMLVKSDSTIVGMVKLTNTEILGKDYLVVSAIYVPPEFRKGPALYWLLYAVKETVTKDVIADGAIFSDEQSLVNAIQKHNMFYVFNLNKETGEVSEVHSPIRSLEHCYLFKTTKLGFGEQMFVEGMKFTWYNLFGEIED